MTTHLVDSHGDRYGNAFLLDDAPDDRLPAAGHAAGDAMRLLEEELRARRHPDAQPRDVRDDVDGARGAAGHRREPAPQLHRPRRVPADGRDRAALHPHARRPLPRAGRDDRHAHPGLLGGDHARRAVAEVEVARAPRGGGQAHRPPEPRLRRRRARRVGEVLPLLRRRAADHPAAAATGSRSGRRTSSRTSTRTRSASPRSSARPSPATPTTSSASTTCSSACTRSAASTCRCTSTAPAAASCGRSCTPTRRGTSGSSSVRSINVSGPQVRPRLPRPRLARLPRAGGPARGPRLLRELPRQARRDVHAELLHRARRWCWRSTTTSSATGTRATATSWRRCSPTRARWPSAIVAIGNFELVGDPDAEQLPLVAFKLTEDQRLRRVRRRLAARRRARLDGARLHAAAERRARDDHARAGQADARPLAGLDARRRHRARRARRSTSRAACTSSTAGASRPAPATEGRRRCAAGWRGPGSRC